MADLYTQDWSDCPSTVTDGPEWDTVIAPPRWVKCEYCGSRADDRHLSCWACGGPLPCPEVARAYHQMANSVTINSFVGPSSISVGGGGYSRDLYKNTNRAVFHWPKDKGGW